jgi:predicted O-linked N-acetylglucosamine transferase (SPINDLY family)
MFRVRGNAPSVSAGFGKVATASNFLRLSVTYEECAQQCAAATGRLLNAKTRFSRQQLLSILRNDAISSIGTISAELRAWAGAFLVRPSLTRLRRNSHAGQNAGVLSSKAAR